MRKTPAWACIPSLPSFLPVRTPAGRFAWCTAGRDRSAGNTGAMGGSSQPSVTFAGTSGKSRGKRRKQHVLTVAPNSHERRPGTSTCSTASARIRTLVERSQLTIITFDTLPSPLTPGTRKADKPYTRQPSAILHSDPFISPPFSTLVVYRNGQTFRHEKFLFFLATRLPFVQGGMYLFCLELFVTRPWEILGQDLLIGVHIREGMENTRYRNSISRRRCLSFFSFVFSLIQIASRLGTAGRAG